MLYLIQRNRLGKNIVNEDNDTFNWHQAFKGSEDSLTSSVFSLLFYLPVELFWNILYNACYEPSLPKNCSKLLSYEFWPHWNCRDTDNSNYVEPGLFLEFEHFHLLIEAKRFDFEAQQNPSQWATQIIAYRNEFEENQRKPLYFIALAGIVNGTEKQEPVLSVQVTTCRWFRILYEVKKKINDHLHASEKEIPASSFNILHDLLKSFALHDFRTGELLETMPTIYPIKIVTNLSIDFHYEKNSSLTLIAFPKALLSINQSLKQIPL